ncbi:helix-turn-helix domain-containing protein [Polymorphospora rubra]|uniref:helix-turn-helix domain-containing protein n=1 Tax=Polymorphospora rubra TaxID=338584 RepID=UPI0033E8BE2B
MTGEFWDEPAMRDALRNRHLGQIIRAWRTHPQHGRQAVSQNLVAAWMGITQAQLSRIETGGPVVHLDRLIEWAKALRIPPHLLWFTLPTYGDSDSQETLGQSPIGPPPLRSAAEGAAAAENNTDVPLSVDRESDEEDLVDVAGRIQRLRRTVAPEVIDHLRDSLRGAIEGYERSAASTQIHRLIRQRRWIDELVGECGDQAQQRQLFAVAAGISGLLGYITAGRSRFVLARAYCEEAFQLGRAANDANLQAWARGLQSFCEYYARRYNDAFDFAVDGLAIAGSGPQSVRLAVNGVARSLGKLGDAEGVHRIIGDAYGLLARNEPPSGIPSSISFDCYSETQVASNAATAYVSLGMPEKVDEYISLALPEIIDSGSTWSRSLVTLDIAKSCTVSKGDLDRACDAAIEALKISFNKPVVSVEQRATEFVQAATQAWGNVSQVQQVSEALAHYVKGYRVG